MPTPQLQDDGSAVTLDLHGATVDEAVAMSLRTVRLAAERGRMQVTLIHGASTTRGAPPYRRTIKRALYEVLDEDGFRPYATEGWRADGHLVLSLDITTAVDSTPIRLADVM